MKMKKTQKMMMSLAVSFIMLASAVSPVFAANTSDTTLPTGFISYSSNVTTTVRSKTNTTPVYIKNTSGMNLWVYANGGSKPSNPSVVYSTGTTQGGFAKVLSGQYVIHTLIYENGYRSAWLNISTATNGVSGNCKGVWSPDTAGSYTSAN